jgi:hypothetical protein
MGDLRLLRQPFPLFLGLRLHLVCTLGRLPLASPGWAKATDREVLGDLVAVEPELVAVRPGQVLLADKNYDGDEFERVLAGWVCGCCGRPARARQSGPARPVQALAAADRVGQPDFKGQLDLERHDGRTLVGPGLAAHPGLDRRDLAQRQDRTANPAVAGRL